MNIGVWIKQYREKNDISQEDFGKKVGVNKQTVSKWENGSLEPSVEMYYQFSQIFGVPLDEIITRQPCDGPNAVPVYRDNYPYNIGFNCVFNSISDFETLFVFLKMTLQVKSFFKRDRPLGFLVLGKDITIEEKIDEPINAIPIVEFYLNNPDELVIHLAVTDEEDGFIISKGSISKIEPKNNFRNVFYSINLYVNTDDGNDIIQINIDMDDENELF